MEEQKPKDKLLPVSGVVALVLALSALWLSMAPLKGTRPDIPEVDRITPKVRARLWQDPFCAALEYAKAKGSRSFERSPHVCFRNRSSQKNLTILGVMLFGTPYSEDIESRIRHRYAVLSGLVRLGFRPEDPEHIGVFINAVSRPYSNGNMQSEWLIYNEPCLENVIPFEWLTKEDEDVLVLWLNNNGCLWNRNSGYSSKKQLHNIYELFGCVKDCAGKRDVHKINLKIIGPAGSLHLLEMLKEITAANDLHDVKDHIQIFTATATAPDKWLLDKAQRQPLANSNRLRKDKNASLEIQENISTYFKERLGNNLLFSRNICTDDKLAEALIIELYHRNVDLLSRKNNHVVLIAESDTVFGWSLPETFIDSLISLRKEIKDIGFGNCDSYLQERHNRKNDPEPKGKENNEGNKEEIKFVHCFNYFRGLDGKVPGEHPQSAQERQKDSSDRKEDKNLERLEEPAGKSQYDSLRRLAEDIYQLDQGLQFKCEGAVKAIGILGSDFHDKYLVLQALRQRYPQLVFFTIDLDARFLYPTYNKHTRNLVVASGFGLQLRRELQKYVPPFRDTHQTSMFLATLRAFSDSLKDNLKIEGLDDDKINKLLQHKMRAQIFEIGRTQAIDLTDHNKFPDDDVYFRPYKLNPMNESFWGKIYDWRRDNLKLIINYYANFIREPSFGSNIIITITAMSFSLIILSLIILILYFSETFYQLFWQKIYQHKLKSFIGFLILSAIILSLIHIGNLPTEEPFHWTEEVSIWPTEILRLLACFLAVFFFFRSRKQLRENNAAIAEEFALGNQGKNDKSSVKNHSKVKLWAKIKNKMRYNWEVDNKNGSVITMNELWAEYLRRGTRNLRIWRLWPFMPLMVFVFLLVWPSMAIRPIRGFWSSGVDVLILIFTLVCFFILTFYIYDNTRLCRRFIKLIELNLLNDQLYWGKNSWANFSKKAGAPEEEVKYWMAIRLIGQVTEPVVKLIFYPFIILVIILAARSSLFDNWSAPLTFFALVFSLFLLYTWHCAIMLWSQAEKTRTAIVNDLSKKLMQAVDTDPDEKRRKQIEFVLKEIKENRKGAFAPLYQQPVLQSLLVPFGGLGGLQLLDLLIKR